MELLYKEIIHTAVEHQPTRKCRLENTSSLKIFLDACSRVSNEEVQGKNDKLIRNVSFYWRPTKPRWNLTDDFAVAVERSINIANCYKEYFMCFAINMFE